MRLAYSLPGWTLIWLAYIINDPFGAVSDRLFGCESAETLVGKHWVLEEEAVASDGYFHMSH